MRLIATALFIGASVTAALASAPSLALHQCVMTRISSLGSRLDGAPDSGSAVLYENGLGGVSYDLVPAVRASRVGDPVRVCLVEIPKGCPKGDQRGLTYAALNLRTGGKWVLPNAEHMCGGA